MRQLSQGAYFFQSFPYQPIHWRDAWLSTCSQWFNVILQSTPPGKQVLSESHWILEEVGQESGGQLLVTSYQFWDALVVVVQYVLTLWTQSFCPLTTPSVLEVNHQFSRMVVPFGWRYALNWNMVIRKSTDKGGWTYMARCMCLFFNWEWLRMMYSCLLGYVVVLGALIPQFSFTFEEILFLENLRWTLFHWVCLASLVNIAGTIGILHYKACFSSQYVGGSLFVQERSILYKSSEEWHSCSMHPSSSPKWWCMSQRSFS